MTEIKPKTFYDWLMLLNQHGLKCGPLEAFRESRTHHALSRTNGRLTFGLWDHQSNTGFLNPDGLVVPAKEIKEAPPVADGDKEWDL